MGLMDDNKIVALYQTIESIRHINGTEFWYARDLFGLLGYPNLESFYTALERAMDACRNSGSQVSDHFTIVKRDIAGESGIIREGEDIRLTRYASYLVALNADPKKEEVAFCQTYFVTQTRKIEVLQQKMIESERLEAREKLKLTEKDFSTTVYNRGVSSNRGIATIKSLGDRALFGKTTEEMKRKYGIGTQPLADFLPSISLKAKDLAMAMTTENTKKKNLTGFNPILREHEESNVGVRGALVKSGIYPENLPPAEDIKKLQSAKKKDLRQLQKPAKKTLKSKKKRGI